MNRQEFSNALDQFTGTESYHRWSTLFPNIVLTDGAHFVAENGAYWIMDIIGSYQPELQKLAWARAFQIWELKVNLEEHTAVITCREDSDTEPVVTQEIPFTDFDLPNIKFYVQNNVIMLPREY